MWSSSINTIIPDSQAFKTTFSKWWWINPSHFYPKALKSVRQSSSRSHRVLSTKKLKQANIHTFCFLSIDVISKEAHSQRLDAQALFYPQAHNIFMTNLLQDD